MGRRPAGYYDTLTKSSLHQRKSFWLDDHPPTRPFSREPFDQDEGAEVYAHLALIAIKHGTLGSTINFAPYVRHPPSYNELRKAALAAGRADFDATVNATGRLERLHLELPPATVNVRLFPSDRRISALRLRKFAME